MNLYRSFGNLLEAWVSEEGRCSDSEWLGHNDEDSPTPSSDAGTNLRSESVDSGVETASSDTSFPATCCSVSTENAEIDTFAPEREGDGLTPASTSQSPVLSSPVPSFSSSSSSCLCPSRAREGSTALHRKVGSARQRTDSHHLQDVSEPLTVEEVLRRRPRASFLPKRHSSELLRGQRSDNYDLRTVNWQMCRRPMSLNYDKKPPQTRLEDLGEEEEGGKGLSPGFSYLEQVCQMLEEIARQQLHSRASQMETDALREHQDTEDLDTCQSDSKAAEEDLSSCPRLENTESAEHSSSNLQWQKDNPHRHFRRRSASDTAIATLHLRKLNADCRGQHLSTHGLLEKVEEDHEKQEKKTLKKNWKLRIGSLRKEESAVRDTNGQQMQPSEKNSARRRLSQLFRRSRTKTLPA